MGQAIILLMTALQLLTSVGNNPNLPQSFKDMAIGIANNAIEFANNELNKPVEQPKVLGVIVPEVKPEIVKEVTPEIPILKPYVAPIVNKELKIFIGGSNGDANRIYYTVHARYSENGNDVLDVPITFKSSEGLEKIILTDKYGGENHAGAGWTYVPDRVNTVTFTITANGITKTIEGRGQVR